VVWYQPKGPLPELESPGQKLLFRASALGDSASSASADLRLLSEETDMHPTSIWSRLLVMGRIAAAVLLVFAQLCAPAQAQSAPKTQQVNPPAKPPPAYIPRRPGSVTLPTEREQIEDLRKKVDALQHRVDAIEQSRLTFSCKSEAVSVNNRGIEENCSPYICRPIDGRCSPHSCANVHQCAPGFVCDTDNRCRAM
jgi:hypothetical protein